MLINLITFMRIIQFDKACIKFYRNTSLLERQSISHCHGLSHSATVRCWRKSKIPLGLLFSQISYCCSVIGFVTLGCSLALRDYRLIRVRSIRGLDLVDLVPTRRNPKYVNSCADQVLSIAMGILCVIQEGIQQNEAIGSQYSIFYSTGVYGGLKIYVVRFFLFPGLLTDLTVVLGHQFSGWSVGVLDGYQLRTCSPWCVLLIERLFGSFPFTPDPNDLFTTVSGAQIGKFDYTLLYFPSKSVRLQALALQVQVNTETYNTSDLKGKV